MGGDDEDSPNDRDQHGSDEDEQDEAPEEAAVAPS
jgi:hypothetical protein